MSKLPNNTLSPFSADPLSAIVGHYADVIEGGSKWREADYFEQSGGSSSPYEKNYLSDMEGVAGYGSPHRFCDAPALSLGGSTTTVNWEGASGELEHRPDLTASPFFVHCISGTPQGTNSPVGQVRRITSQDYDHVDGFQHTTGAFDGPPYNPFVDDMSVQLLEGFTRVVPGVDIDGESTGVPQGMDRVFSIDIEGPGEELEMRGAGFVNRATDLVLRVRYQRSMNHRISTAMMFHNANILTRAMELGSNRDPFYTRALSLSSIESEEADSFHLVEMNFRLEYRSTPMLREATSRLSSLVDTA